MSISTLIWTTSGNVETTLPFSKSVYSTLSHIKITLWIWPLKKWKNKLRVKNIIILLSFNKNHLNWIPWTQNLLHFVPLFKKNGCKAVKNLKTLWIWCVMKAVFKLIHFTNCQLLFKGWFRNIMINVVLIRI